jgi:tetratricopeptide (TPR) repeat protein
MSLPRLCRTASRLRALLAGCAPCLLLAAPTALAGELQFLNGGYAELCARVAQQVYLGTAEQYYEITGSRVGLTPMEICNRAVNGYDGSGENVAESYNNRGVLWFAQGGLEAALQDFGRAIRQQESMAQAHINRGYTLIALQRWQEAIPTFTRGLELGSSEEARALYNRGIAHEETGALREAYQDYRRAAELAPDWDEPQLELQRFQVSLKAL